jgi:hypothetical protein
MDPVVDVFNIVGTNMTLLAITSSAERTQVTFFAGATAEFTVELNAANSYTYIWTAASGTNPITGDTITQIKSSTTGIATAGVTLRIQALFN